MVSVNNDNPFFLSIIGRFIDKYSKDSVSIKKISLHARCGYKVTPKPELQCKWQKINIPKNGQVVATEKRTTTFFLVLPPPLLQNSEAEHAENSI
jgi:hypothetical protein